LIDYKIVYSLQFCLFMVVNVIDVRNIEEITSEFEKYSVQLSEQRFNQIAGLTYDGDKMQNLSEKLVQLSSEFLNSVTSHS
jgi:hypothetical protein